MLTALVAYLLTTFGFCYVVGHSKISLPVRELLSKALLGRMLLALVECPACLGWWVGLLTAGSYPPLTPFPVFPHETWLNVFAWAFATCGAHYLLACWSGWISEDADA